VETGIGGIGSKICFGWLAAPGNSCITIVLGKGEPGLSLNRVTLTEGQAMRRESRLSQQGFKGRFLVVVTAYSHRSYAMVDDVTNSYLVSLGFPSMEHRIQLPKGDQGATCSMAQASLESMERICRPTHLESEEGVKPGGAQ
jgi:hypothetical protein